MKERGFSLIEVMILIAIIGIIVAIAIPAYQNYTRRAHYSEIVLAMAPFKSSVITCVQKLGKLQGCTSGRNGVPAAIDKQGGINSLTVKNGEITIIPLIAHGITEKDTLVATPTLTANKQINWMLTGGAVDKGYIK